MSKGLKLIIVCCRGTFQPFRYSSNTTQMRFTERIIIALVCLLCLLIVGFRLQRIFHSSKTAKTFGICSTEAGILNIQRDQWNKARLEVLGSSQVGFQGEDFEFYKRSFGAVELLLGNNKKKLNALVYYRIFKNANDNIRSMMLEHAYQIDGREEDYRRQNCTFNECVHRRMHYLTPDAVKSLYFPYHYKRFAFSFTREPISRFISAVTEIEYRMKLAELKKGKVKVMPFQSKLGSQLRFKEFIKMILLSGGSRSLFRDYADIEISHIIPQIPTILLAQKVEGDGFHIYRLADFDNDWSKMVNESQLTKLQSVYRGRGEREWNHHSSSLDPYGTTLAAKAFLSFASVDAFNQFGMNISEENLKSIPSGYTQQEYRHVARQHLRAVCRIYLTDFLCLNYTLPADCSDLQQEAEISHQTYLTQSGMQHGKAGKEFSMLDTLRMVTPVYLMEQLATALCIGNPTPECEAYIVHGESSLDYSERHDEL